MSDPEVIQISRNPIKLLIWLAIAVACGWLVWSLFTTVLIFSLAALLAYLVSPAVAWLSNNNFPFTRKRIPWGLSVLVVYVIIVTVLVVCLLVFIPLLVSQTGTLAASMPGVLDRIHVIMQSSSHRLQGWYRRLHVSPEIETELKAYGAMLMEKVGPVFSGMVANLVGGVLKFVSAFFVVIAAFLVSLYIVIDEKNIKRHFVEMFPEGWRDDTEELMHNVGRVVGAFIRGEIVLSIVVGSVSYLVLLFLKLCGIRFEYALLASLVIALLYPIPFIGVWAPRVLIPILAYFQPGGWVAALSTFLVITGVGLVVDNAILPLVMGKGVGISPLMVLLVVFAGGEMFGIWGLILSVPAAAIIRLIFFYLHKHFTI